MLISLITLGDPQTLTGGYLYHLRLAERADDHGARMTFASFPQRVFPMSLLDGRDVVPQAASADVAVVDSIAAAFTAPWLRRLRIPVIGMAHQQPGGMDHSRLRATAQAALDLYAYRQMSRLLVASDALAEHFAGRGIPRESIRVVPPGKDPAAPPAGPPPDLRLGTKTGFLCVANWIERKGIVDLLHAFAKLPARAGMLHLVGDERADLRYATRVRDVLARADLAGRVVTHGPVSRERIATLYAAADVFVLPSYQEPYGTVYGEAMAAGLPVVGWRAGNLPYLATHEHEGLILAPGDIDALATSLRRLAEDVAFREVLGEHARARGASLPTWDDTADMFFGALGDVVA